MRGPMTHPDTDVLAEYRAGLITGRRGTAIAAHLAGCGRCSATDGRLAEVSVLLAAVPAAAMPEHVALRLDAVLAAEADSRDGAERAGVASTPERPAAVPPRARNHGFRFLSPRALVPAAAVAVLAAGGFWLSQAGAGPGTRAASSSSAAAGRAVKPAAGPAAASDGSVPSPSVGGPAIRRALPEAASVSVVTSPVDLAPGQLKQQLEAALQAPGGTARAASPQTRGCVRYVTGGTNPVRVLSARYEGSRATIIVTREGQGLLARVEGPRCSATRPDLLATATLPPGI